MAVGTKTKPTPEPLAQGRFWDNFRLDSPNGVLAVISIALLLVTPTLAVFVSHLFLFLLPVAWALSVGAHLRESGLSRRRRLTRTGQMLAFNGLVLIVALFFVGFIADFLSTPHSGGVAVGAGFTTVHVLFGTGLILREVVLD